VDVGLRLRPWLLRGLKTLLVEEWVLSERKFEWISLEGFGLALLFSWVG